MELIDPTPLKYQPLYVIDYLKIGKPQQEAESPTKIANREFF